MTPGLFITGGFFLALICAAFGYSIAESKNRSPVGGALLGLFLGLLGLAILALLSKLPEDESAAAAGQTSVSTKVRPGGAQARLDAASVAVVNGAYREALAPMEYEIDQAGGRGDLEALEYLLGLARHIESAPDADPDDRLRARELVGRLEQVAPSLVASDRLESALTTEASGLTDTPRSPLDIVKERYARGEITREEFQQFAADLG